MICTEDILVNDATVDARRDHDTLACGRTP